MRKRMFLFGGIIFVCMALLAACQNESDDENELTAEETAESFLVHLSEGNYDEAYDQLDEGMEEAIETNDLEDVWSALEQSIGEHVSFEYESTDSDDGYEIVYIKSRHSKEDITFMVTVNGDLEVAGFFVV